MKPADCIPIDARPGGMTVMFKPVGALCNLDCQYCYYLPTQRMFGEHMHRMTEATLDSALQGLLPRMGDDVTIAWQGGEPMLAGLEFFQRALELQEKHQRPAQRVCHALQTNGTLLDEDWCRFFKEKQFLVGLSIDGPPKHHDRYRVNKTGEASSGAVFAGLRLLQSHRIAFNLLCVLNDQNVRDPDGVLDYLLSLGTPWVQFIPAMEWKTDPTDPSRPAPMPFSPDSRAYGEFLCRVFDRWFDRLRHRVSIQMFDAVLSQLVMGQTPLCILGERCHSQLTIEHDGSIFGCDHYVEDRWRLGRVDGADWWERVDHAKLETFAARKQRLPAPCDECRYRRFCHGGCPKHRPHRGDVPEPTALCEGYRMFFEHALPRLEWLADWFRRGLTPPPPQTGKKHKSRS